MLVFFFKTNLFPNQIIVIYGKTIFPSISLLCSRHNHSKKVLEVLVKLVSSRLLYGMLLGLIWVVVAAVWSWVLRHKGVSWVVICPLFLFSLHATKGTHMTRLSPVFYVSGRGYMTLLYAH